MIRLYNRGLIRLALPLHLIWAIVGLLLTIGGTLLEAAIASPAALWGGDSLQVHGLGVTYQVGAVLLTACLGGPTAGALAQVAYVALGLLGVMGQSIFGQGGGLAYVHQPTFGYLLGFIPGAWICGWLAFRLRPRLELLTVSCVAGLGAIHLCGVAYLALLGLPGWLAMGELSLSEAIARYTVDSFAPQLAVVCATALFAFGLRRLLLY